VGAHLGLGASLAGGVGAALGALALVAVFGTIILVKKPTPELWHLDLQHGTLQRRRKGHVTEIRLADAEKILLRVTETELSDKDDFTYFAYEASILLIGLSGEGPMTIAETPLHGTENTAYQSALSFATMVANAAGGLPIDYERTSK
jgi:hypothetical protein